jgi:hypothetical protein
MQSRNQRPVVSRLVSAMLTLFGLLFTACSGGGGGGGGATRQLASLSMLPNNPSVALGFTRAITVTGIYDDLTTEDLTGSVQWTVANTAVATVDQGGDTPGMLRSLTVGSTSITATEPTTGITVTATAEVRPATLVAITVEPPLASVASGYGRQFAAIGRFSDATTQDLTAVVDWSTTPSAIAGMDTQPGTRGFATGRSLGTATVRARHPESGIDDTAELTVTDAVLALLAITPAQPSSALGFQEQCSATGTFSDGSTQDLTSVVQWVSASTNVATIDSSVNHGLVTTLATGTTVLTATEPTTGIVATATMTVTPAVLLSLAITPPAPGIALGYEQQFTATGTFSDNTTQDLTAAVTWNSTATEVATVANAEGSQGLATSVGTGTTTISATVPGTTIADATLLAVTPAVLLSIEVTPSMTQLPLGYDQQFTATGTFSDDTTQDLTTTVAWSTSMPTTATIGNGLGSQGLATGTAEGTTVVIAEAPGTGIQGGTTLTITPAVLLSLDVTPAQPSLALGYGQMFTATGLFSDNSTRDLTGSVTWIASNPGVASIESGGEFAGRAQTLTTGVTTILAYAPDSYIVGATNLIVTPAVLVAVEVYPTDPQVALGYDRQFMAIGRFSDDSTQVLTDVVTWSSSSTGVATISNAIESQGLASSAATGSTTITATEPGTGIAGNTTLTVDPAVLVSLAVTPTAPQQALGFAQQFTAIGTFSDNTTQDLTGFVTWSSATPAVATIANTMGEAGRATTVGIGTTTITATAPETSISADTTLTVDPAVLVAVEVSPSSPTQALGYQQQFTATGRFSDNSTTDLTNAVTWASSAPGTAVISNAMGSAGLATSMAVGSTTISATEPVSSLVGNVTLSITPAVLVSIAVTPGNPELALGYQQPFVATGTFSDNTTQDLTESVTWTTSQATIATVANAPGSRGLATSAAVGSTTITATDATSGINGGATLTVTPAVLVSLGITPSSSAVALGYQQQFIATGVFSDNSTQDLTTSVTWSSTQTAMAVISNAPGTEGLATTVATGTTTIAAIESGSGITGNTQLQVTPAVLVSLALTPANASLALGYQEQFSATGTFSDNTTQDLTSSVTWTSTVEPVATISNAAGSEGIATSAGQGATTIVATDPASGVFGITTLTVTPAVMVSIALSPANSSQALGYGQQFEALATFSDNSTQSVTTTVNWQSSDTGVANISNASGSNGVATSVGQGATTISATDPESGVSATTTYTITPAVLVSVVVSPTPTTVSLGFTRQFAASGVFSDNSTQDLTAFVTWSSSATAVATVSNAAGSEGRASTTSVGSTTITATDPATGINGTASMQVTAAVLVSIAVTPGNLSLAPGFSQQFLAIGTYSDSTTQNLTNQVNWASSTGAATISNTPGSVGLATGASAGTTAIEATHTPTGIIGSTTLQVGSGIVHRQTTTATSGNNVLLITLTVPPLTAAGDQMLAAITVRASAPTVTAPSGWALIRRSNATGTNANSLLVYRRTAGAGEPVNQVFTFSASAGAVGSISTFQGVNTTNPVHTSNNRASAASLSHATTSLTTTIADTMIVTFHSIGSNATWTPPSGMNEVADLQSGAPDTTGGVGMTVSWQFQAAAGATGARTAVASSNPAIGNATTVALRN